MTVEELLADFQKQKQTVLTQIKEGEATISVLKEKLILKKCTTRKINLN